LNGLNYGEPRGRPLSVEEVVKLLECASDHVWLTIILMIGTCGRPEAVFDLVGSRLDFKDRLIELNPVGRAQTKKYRPIVKMPDTLAVILDGAPDDHLVTFKGKPVKSIKRAWRNLRERAGLDDRVNPYSIRHTMARHLRASGVPMEETAMQLGHKARSFRTTELYAPYDPAYLSRATEAIELFFAELRAKNAPVDEPYFVAGRV